MDKENHLLLVEPEAERRTRALLVKVIEKEETQGKFLVFRMNHVIPPELILTFPLSTRFLLFGFGR
jgi:hypothetical protein